MAGLLPFCVANSVGVVSKWIALALYLLEPTGKLSVFFLFFYFFTFFFQILNSTKCTCQFQMTKITEIFGQWNDRTFALSHCIYLYDDDQLEWMYAMHWMAILLVQIKMNYLIESLTLSNSRQRFLIQWKRFNATNNNAFNRLESEYDCCKKCWSNEKNKLFTNIQLRQSLCGKRMHFVSRLEFVFFFFSQFQLIWINCIKLSNFCDWNIEWLKVVAHRNKFANVKQWINIIITSIVVWKRKSNVEMKQWEALVAWARMCMCADVDSHCFSLWLFFFVFHRFVR